MHKNYKIFFTFILLFILVLSFNTKLDETVLHFHDEAFERALSAFAMAKALNAVISLIQGTYVSFTPIGIGVEFSVGEVLDPINDLVERFSWIMLAATVSLGIQKILITLSNLPIMQFLLLISSLSLGALIWLKPQVNYLLLNFKVLSLAIVLKFSIVFFVTIELMSYNTLMKEDYLSAQSVLIKTHSELQAIQVQTSQENISSQSIQAPNKHWYSSKVMDSASQMFDSASQQYQKASAMLNIKDRLDALEESIDEAQREILNLITMFIVQSILLPLLFLWFLITVLRLIFKWSPHHEKA